MNIIKALFFSSFCICTPLFAVPADEGRTMVDDPAHIHYVEENNPIHHTPNRDFNLNAAAEEEWAKTHNSDAYVLENPPPSKPFPLSEDEVLEH